MSNLIKLIPTVWQDRYRNKYYQLIFDCKIIIAKISRQFYRPPFPKSESGNINLHLGCGSINHPEFVNVDGASFSHVHYVRAIDDLSPFKDKTINLIYACHCLEHFSHQEVSTILSHWFRKLRHGGTLRLSVPDFDLLVDIYLKNHRDVSTIVYPLMGGQVNKFDFHKIAFTHISLKQLLIDAGFTEVREWLPHSSKLGGLDDWSNRQIQINDVQCSVSLNLEAVK
jgi:predicted SAM-dependent methyltransferase